MLRVPASAEIVTTRAGPVCLSFAGVIHASIVSSLDDLTALYSFRGGSGDDHLGLPPLRNSPTTSRPD
jgi:hypothetical protein